MKYTALGRSLSKLEIDDTKGKLFKLKTKEKDTEMKVTITSSHIKAAKLSKGKITPVEVALIDLDCFEEIYLSQNENGKYNLLIDGESVKLPRSIQQALKKFDEIGEMNSTSFDLPVENNDFFSEEDSLFEPIDDGFSFGFV